jgi:hypothetical protein
MKAIRRFQHIANCEIYIAIKFTPMSFFCSYNIGFTYRFLYNKNNSKHYIKFWVRFTFYYKPVKA